ncbi:MAG TPA: 2-dehydro-3-deoxyglucarate aldolase [Ktedonobacter sp.]|nr:2-dehydro-3-deoxyglucarate aldolase [Ktedonobacter sp.]
MRTNHVKQKLKRGEPVLGAWLNLPDVSSARIMARLGFDWLLVDMEHTAHHPALMSDIIGTIADAGTCAPLVRVPSHGVEWFKWALDAGAWGVVVPMVESREEALRVVNHTKYPPVGTRSFGGAFGPYGFGTLDRATYTQSANDEILVAVQIESAPALQHVDEILSVPGIDVAFVGPNDLHFHLGLTPSNEGAEPEFVEALGRIKTAAQKYQLALGMFCTDGKAAAQRIHEGFHMVSITSDVSCLIAEATRNLQVVRES